jgi:hypothetical protein
LPMFTLNTFAVATLTDEGVSVIARCANRVTAEFFSAKFGCANVVVLAPGAGFTRDISHEPSVSHFIGLKVRAAAA